MNTRVKSPSMHFFFFKGRKKWRKNTNNGEKKTCILKRLNKDLNLFTWKMIKWLHFSVISREHGLLFKKAPSTHSAKELDKVHTVPDFLLSSPYLTVLQFLRQFTRFHFPPFFLGGCVFLIWKPHFLPDCFLKVSQYVEMCVCVGGDICK